MKFTGKSEQKIIGTVREEKKKIIKVWNLLQQQISTNYVQSGDQIRDFPSGFLYTSGSTLNL